MPGEASRQNGKLGGRPKGSVSNPFRKAFNEAWTGEKLDLLLNKAIAKVRAGDSKMISYVFDQLMGKATQPVDMDAKMELLEYVIKRGNAEEGNNTVDTTQGSEGDS